MTMISVSISQSDDGKFNLSVTGGHRRVWQIARSFEDFTTLKADLEEWGVNIDPQITLTKDTTSLQTYLDAVLAVVEEKLWKTTPLLRFLDNVAEKSFMVELQLQYFAEQIENLNKKTADIEKIQLKMQASFNQFNDSIKGYSSVLHRGNRHYSIKYASIESPTKDPSPEDGSTPADQSEAANRRESVISNSTFDDETSSVRSPVASGEYSIFGYSNRSSVELNAEPSGAFTKPTLPKSQFMEEELLPLGEKSALYDATIDSLLEIVGPTEQQMQHRLSIIALLKRLIRVSLGASVFEIGIPATRCILPDDPVRLMVTLPKATVPTWHTQLCEYLTHFADKASAYGGSNYVPVEEEEVLDAYFNDSTVTKNHFLGNITHVKQNLAHMVLLVIDSIQVEIIANNRIDLCLIGFFEEISHLVNSNYLFKRSFLLIRAWWCYETPAFVGCVIRHYLTDYQLFVMVTAIFNQYSSFITTPFQALCIFLLEYSSYDGNSQAISIFGIIPFQTRASNQPVIPDIRSYSLIKNDLLDKYWQIFNVTHIQDQDQQIVHKKRSSSSEDPVSLEGSGKTNAENGISPEGEGNNTSNNNIMMIERNHIIESLKHLSAANLQFFDRSSFNVVHPLSHTNMILEKLSQRRVSRLARAFQIGATNLAFFLKRVQEEGATEGGESIKTYFPNIAGYSNPWTKQFKEGSMLDVLCYAIPIPKIEADIRYGDLMIEAIVTDQALLTLAMEILAMKGPLPVGEIGKILAEMTSIPSLSLRLKEKYGGLKKFLEQYPGQFVVSNDHPFNPNVLLKSSLTSEHLELLDKGIFPHQLLVKSKKSSSASKKKKSHSIPQSNGENSTRYEYHPYAQMTLHQSLPRNGQLAANLSIAMSNSNVNSNNNPSAKAPMIASGATQTMANKLNNLPPNRRASLTLSKTAQPFVPSQQNSSPTSNIYSQGIATDHYQYTGASNEDLYGSAMAAHGHYNMADNKSYDSYNNNLLSNNAPTNAFQPSPSVSERNSVNFAVNASPSFNEDYHPGLSNTHSSDAFNNPYLSQLRTDSLDPQAIGHGHNSSGYYQDVLGNRGLPNDNNANYLGNQNQNMYANYPGQRTSGNLTGLGGDRNSGNLTGLGGDRNSGNFTGLGGDRNSGNLTGLTEHLGGRNYSMNGGSNGHLSAGVVGNSMAGRRDSNRQAGNFSHVSSLLFGDQSGSPHNSMNLGNNQFAGLVTSSSNKERPVSGSSSSVLSNLFPSLLSSSEPSANALLSTDDSLENKYRNSGAFNNKFF